MIAGLPGVGLRFDMRAARVAPGWIGPAFASGVWLGPAKRQRFATIVCTGWSFWLSVVIRTRTIPRDGCSLDGVTARISQCRCRVSPGRTGRGHRNSSTPLPMMPWDSGKASTISCIVIAVVCHPLATISPKKVVCAAASSRWKGCRSNSPENRLIEAASTTARVRREHLPRREVFEIGFLHCLLLSISLARGFPT
ncbi:MAG: hypothetical protein QOD25_2855 [Alphaproteobacteria bacterium]|nr:hypothetical protein [Alphaproteobacteria bacterium]